MKKTAAILAVTFVSLFNVAESVRAQIPVTDAASIAQSAGNAIKSAIDMALSAAKQAKMISNQVEQIQMWSGYMDRMGSVAKQIRKFDFDELFDPVNGIATMWHLGKSVYDTLSDSDESTGVSIDDDNGGLYSNIDLGADGVDRNYDAYKRFDALTEQRNSYQKMSSEKYTAAAKKIRTEIDKTLAAMDIATDSAELQKLQGKLQGLLAHQQLLDTELNRRALDQTVAVQDLQVRERVEKLAASESIGGSVTSAYDALQQQTAPSVQSMPLQLRER